MSLLKRLLMSVTIIMVCILVGTMVVSMGAARQYLNGQLQSQGDNAASALALLLSQPANQDPATRETLMTALFDSGQFRKIALESKEGAVLFARTLAPSSGKPVPEWFRRLLPVAPVTAVRDITDGWKQVGELTVVVDDASAAEALWRGSSQLFVLVVLAGVVWALFVALLVNWFERALSREIRHQLEAVGHDLEIQKESSSLRELADVSAAIQDTEARVRATSKALNERIDSLETEVNRDPVTRLPNRRYFIDEILRRTEGAGPRAGHSAYVLLIRQRDLTRINQAMTRPRTDQWLYGVGQSIVQATGSEAPEAVCLVARLNGSDFALFIQEAGRDEVLRLANAVRTELSRQRVEWEDGGHSRWAYALASWAPGHDLPGLLLTLDLSLMRLGNPQSDEIHVIGPAGDGEQDGLSPEA